MCEKVIKDIRKIGIIPWHSRGFEPDNRRFIDIPGLFAHRNAARDQKGRDIQEDVDHPDA
jgi:hypothetical protein